MVCEGCAYYAPIERRILVVKLGATGDVLRTTPLLASLQECYPQAHITWITGRGSAPLLRQNPQIDRLLITGAEAMAQLETLHFDLAVNLDLDPEATAILERVQATEKKGFGLSAQGATTALNPEAEPWLDMSLWDDLKKANTKTYQWHMRQIIGAPQTPHPITLPLPPESQQKALAFAQQQGLHKPNRPIIGFNVGAGPRWQHKKWTVEGFCQLARMVTQKLNAQVLILYGPEDRGRAQEVMAALDTPYIDAGLHDSMLDFAAILELCGVIVTGDTFALHAALARGCRVVCLVGPTSAAELELYDQGVILQGDIDCLGCYLTRCDKDPFCMKLLPAERVFEAVQIELQHHACESARTRTESAQS